MRFLHIILWLLIVFNFCAASVILYIPYTFTHWIENVASRYIAPENSLLEMDTQRKLPTIDINGPITGEAELVKKQN
jgi:hypothetical protein